MYFYERKEEGERGRQSVHVTPKLLLLRTCDSQLSDIFVTQILSCEGEGGRKGDVKASSLGVIVKGAGYV
jgi:hypothetical protein